MDEGVTAMQEEQTETTATSTDVETTAAAGKSKAKRDGGEKQRRTHGERAMASLRAAKRGQREVTEPADKAQFLLAEANVLALLDVADALGAQSPNGADQKGEGGPTPQRR
jgi:hypothetical protein